MFPTVSNLLKWTADTGSECAGNVFRHFPVLTSQIRTDSSKEPRKQALYNTAQSPKKSRKKRPLPEVFIEILTRYHEIGLGVKVATEGIVAVALQGFQTLA